MKRIMILGGTGSFGRAYTKKLLGKEDTEKVVIVSRNEENQVNMRRVYEALGENRLEFKICDIRNYDRLSEIICESNVEVVILASALKHIDLCEKNIEECIDINVFGSMNVIKACVNNGVKKLICLSTDKATSASTTYGSTKFLMECMAKKMRNKDTEIICTRYGNVLGSSGSVVPLFKRMAEQKNPLTVVNREVTRFFMSMEQACNLVDYAIVKGKHGDLIVCDNKAASVGDIADCISDKQVITGFRCVEKTDEALLTVAEKNQSIFKDGYFVVNDNNVNTGLYTKPFTSDNAERFGINELKRLIDDIEV